MNQNDFEAIAAENAKAAEMEKLVQAVARNYTFTVVTRKDLIPFLASQLALVVGMVTLHQHIVQESDIEKLFADTIDVGRKAGAMAYEKGRE